MKALTLAAALLLCLGCCAAALATNYVLKDLNVGDRILPGDTLEANHEYDEAEFYRDQGATEGLGESVPNVNHAAPGPPPYPIDIFDPAHFGGTGWLYHSQKDNNRYFFILSYDPIAQQRGGLSFSAEYLGNGRFRLNTGKAPVSIQLDGVEAEFTFEDGVITLKAMPAGPAAILSPAPERRIRPC